MAEEKKAVRTYLIPTDQMTLTEQRNMRDAAAAAALERAVTGVKIAGSESEMDVRHLENIFDIGAAVEEYRTAALAVVGTAYTCFQAVVLPATPARSIYVFYAVGIATVPRPVGLLTFRIGGVLGNIIGEFDLSQLDNAWVPEGYFSRPIVIDPNQNFAVQVTCTIATGVFALVPLGCFVIEPHGTRITTV